MFRWTFATINPGGSCSGGFGSCSTTSGNFRIDDFRVTASTVLPVELTHFQATPQGNTTHLTWRTLSETNSDHFQVERSGDGRSFQSFGEVEAAGFSTSAVHYQFTDTAPLPGYNYYRLRQVDFDGSYSFSHIVTVDFRPYEGVAVYPTIVTSTLYVRFAAPPTEPALAFLYDTMGRLHLKSDIPPESDLHEMPLAALPSGVYFLKVQWGQKAMTFRVFR